MHTRAFFKKAYCAHQNRSIACGSVGPIKRFAPDVIQGRSQDIFGQIYPNLSALPHHFRIPCLHFCFLISMVRLYPNEWIGNLSVISFVALLSSELNGSAWTYLGGAGACSPGKIWNLSHLKQLEMPTSSPGLFPRKMGGAGKGPGIGWSRE